MVLDTVTIIGFIGVSGIATREIIEFMKEKEWLTNGLMFLATSFLVNGILALGWAYFNGYQINIAGISAVFQILVSVYFQEYKKSANAQAPQVVIPVSVQEPPVLS